MSNSLDLLKDHIQKIISITEEDYKIIASLFEEEIYKKGSVIFNVNEFLDKHFFICKGLVKLSFIDYGGKEHIISFAMEDWWESDFEAFYKKQRTTMTLVAMENTNVLYITLEKYHQLTKKIPQIEHFFLQKAYNGFIAAQNRIRSTLSSNAEERYHQLIKNHPQWLQRIPKNQIALYLGVSRETLSRLK